VNEKSAVPDLAEFSFSRSSEIGLDAVALSRNIDDRRRFAIAERAGQCRPSRGKDTALDSRGGEVTRMRSFCSERPMEGDRLQTDFSRTSMPRARPGCVVCRRDDQSRWRRCSVRGN
jgi:hypothetical protein